MNEKSFAEIQAMTSAERKDYYAQRAKETNNQPMKKIRRPTRRIEKRKTRRTTNKKIRERKYDRPFDWNPQFQPKVIIANKQKTSKMLKRLGYGHPIPTQ